MADIIKWLFDMIGAVKHFFDKSPTERFIDIANGLNSSTRDFVETVQSDAYRRLLGAFVGLTNETIILVVAIVAAISLANFLGDWAKWFRRLIAGIGAYFVMILLFKPVLSGMLWLSDAARDGVFTLGNVKPGAIAEMINEALGKISLLGGMEYGLATLILAISDPLLRLELQLFKYIGLGLLLIYPLLILFHSLGRGARSWFHTANASLVTVTLAPPLMAVFMLGPHFLSLIGFGGTGTAQAIAMVICIGLATAAPFIVWATAKAGSVRIAGKVTATINGEVLSRQSGEYKVQVEEQPGAMGSFVKTMALGTLGLAASGGGENGSFADGMRSVAVDAAAAALVGIGHPELAALAQGFDAARKHAAKQDAANNPKQPYVPPTPGPLPGQTP